MRAVCAPFVYTQSDTIRHASLIIWVDNYTIWTRTGNGLGNDNNKGIVHAVALLTRWSSL